MAYESAPTVPESADIGDRSRFKDTPFHSSGFKLAGPPYTDLHTWR